MLKPLASSLEGWSPGGGSQPVDPVVLLAAMWGDLVGPEVARNSHPAHITADALMVTTRSSAWSQQLSFLSEHVVELIAARLPKAGIARLRFRVGKLPAQRTRPGAATEASELSGLPRVEQAPAADATEALARFRAGLEAMQRAKREAGWKECGSCGVQIPPGRAQVCMPCRNVRREAQAQAVGRLFYETPGIDFAGAAAQVEGLTRTAFEAEKRRLLSRWRTEIERIGRDGHLSRTGRERLVVSSYVLLKTGIPPERIAPATIRNELGDAIYELVYETERQSKTNGK